MTHKASHMKRTLQALPSVSIKPKSISAFTKDRKSEILKQFLAKKILSSFSIIDMNL